MFGYKVFLSHTNSSEDMVIVEQVVAELDSVGMTSYVAERDRQPGAYLTEKIKAHIRDSDLVVGIWTKSAEGSAYVNNELGYAEDRKPWYLLVERGATVKGFAEGREHFFFDRTCLGDTLIELVDNVSKRSSEKRSIGEIAVVVAVGILTTILVAIAVAYLSKEEK
jgi:hypothetical protein